MTLCHTMGPNRNVLFQTHTFFLWPYGVMWRSVNVRWRWSSWKSPIMAHPTLSSSGKFCWPSWMATITKNNKMATMTVPFKGVNRPSGSVSGSGKVWLECIVPLENGSQTDSQASPLTCISRCRCHCRCRSVWAPLKIETCTENQIRLLEHEVSHVGFQPLPKSKTLLPRWLIIW